jgi:glycosyltransferase involved in cell wall biosynthesis
MKVLIIQSCDISRLQEAVRHVQVRWPEASVTLLLDEAAASGREEWLKGHEALVYGSHGCRPVLSRELRESLRLRRFDVCVLSFTDRFGVLFWTFRLVPLQAGIRRVVAINGRGSITSYGRTAWVASTVAACAILRLADVRLPEPLSRRLEVGVDYMMLAALGVLALGAAALRRLCLYPFARRGVGQTTTVPRLAIFIPYLCLGGAQKALVTVLRRLDRRSCAVQVCTLPGSEQDRFYAEELRASGIALHYLSRGGGVPYWKIIWALTRYFRRESPEVAIGWLPWATCFTAVAASLAGVPRIVMALRSESPARRETRPPGWLRPLEILSGRLADVILANSRACRDDYARWAFLPLAKMKVLYSGIDEQELRPRSEHEVARAREELGLRTRYVVGIVGRLSPEKDHRTFLDAVRILRETVPDVHALVVGDGVEQGRLREAAARMNLSDHVSFLGARRDIPTLMASLDVLALTSRTEGFPMVVLEAQALGVPVVATDAGGTAEALRDGRTGYLVPCGDSRALAARLAQLLLDAGLRRTIGREARRFALNTFGLDRMATELLEHCGVLRPPGARHRRILILQACPVEHFLAATRAVAQRYPQATLTGQVRATDLEQIRATEMFAELDLLPAESALRTAGPLACRSVDLCLVPFESRLGVYHWTFRRIPLLARMPAVASYNGRGTYREWSRAGWWLNTLLMCGAVRAIHRPALWAWLRLRRWLDVAAVFGLALVALALQSLGKLGRHLIQRAPTRPSPVGRQRLVLFIPSLGMGGAQRQLVWYLAHLDRSRWEPEVVMLDLPDKFFESEARSLKVPITYLNTRYDFWMVGVIWRLARHLRAQPCQVLHCWMHYAAMLGSIAGTLAGVPTTIASLRSERPARFPWWYPKWQRGIDILTARLHTRVIGNSEAVKEDNRRWAFIPRRKLVTVYNGIDFGAASLQDGAQRQRLRAELGLPEGAAVVGTVGRLCPEKDYGTFLRAARLIGRVHPDARFVIIGEGELRPWIEQESERLGLSGQVLILGGRKDVAALLQLMDVFVLTSTSEGFPNVLLEAAVARAPVVATAAGGVVEVVVQEETGCVVPCGDAEAVAARVLALVADPVLRKRFADAALARARRCFSASRMAAEIQACYSQTDRGAAGPAPIERQVRVCLISTHAYGFLRPSSGLAVGGAEVQICTLARQLARDPRFEVSVLTGDGGRTGRERDGALTIVLSALFGKLQVVRKPLPTAGAITTGRQAETSDAAARTPLVQTIRRGLDRLPPGLSSGLRGLVRTAYACRERVASLFMPPSRRLVHRGRELHEWGRWIRELHAADADVYVMRCASPQVGYVQAACAVLQRRFVYMVAHEDDVSGAYVQAHGIWGTRFERGLRRAHAIVCQHEGQVGLLRARYGRDGHVIRSLCPMAVPARLTERRQTVLWVARMDEWKQPELFLELAGRIPEARFLMVGPPSDIDATIMPRLRDRMTVLPNLRWMDQVPYDEALRLFEQALVFVNTSRAEGFPNTFLHAAACGTPIVSWAVNPEGMLERHQLGFCANQDWSRFEHCVRLVCADEGLRARLGERGRRYVREHHDPARIAAEYAELFVSLVDGGRLATSDTGLAATRAQERASCVEASRNR